ncbi:hypothetical protein M8J76_004678 [Diaphorina citri]|nr:hypothetical protein M8J76_004678 [Diaphorina citri]
MVIKGTPRFGHDDRYIVNRNDIDFDRSYILLNRRSPDKLRTLELLTNQNAKKTRVLQSNAPGKVEKWDPAEIIKSNRKINAERRINRYPIDVIQAHAASTQFFDNILDLSRKNVNAVALNNYVFLWDLNTNTYLSYEKNRTTPLTSLSWNPDGTKLAISKKHHLDILGGSCADTCIQRANNPIASIKWNPSGRYVATSDPLNGVNIWDVLNLKNPLTKFKKHKSTVKGLAWCPYESGSLASGGGYFDGKVHVWNCNNGKVIDSVSLNTQITGLLWSEADKELLTAHARRGQNNEEDKFSNSKIFFWRYQSSKTSTDHLQKLNHALCNTEEVINITSNDQFFLALCGFNCPKLYLWEKIFNKVPTRLVKSNLTDLNKFK